MTTDGSADRVLDAMPDTVDFRDRIYVPTLVEVPPRIALAAYREAGVPILDQGIEGACTGFGLATVANFLLRVRAVDADDAAVSARMIYEMAKRYDEWPGEDYSGSSARGAMKGWHKHGICAEPMWPYDPGTAKERMTVERAADALKRPLGAYFRVNHKDLVAMHSAIAEVRILYATAQVHSGWVRVGEDGRIAYPGTPMGGHAFAIVAYDARGFWIQNSWGTRWGAAGFAHLSYDDWLANGYDVWVARLGAPVEFSHPNTTAAMRAGAPQSNESYLYCALRPHIVSVGNDGRLRAAGTYALDEEALRQMIREEMPKRMARWKKRRVLLYAHGGLVGEAAAVQRVADYRDPMLDAEVYPLAFAWRSDLWATVTNILKDAVAGRRAEGLLDKALDYLLDRIDDTLEPVARLAGGKGLWDELKENAALATASKDGAARLVAEALGELGDVELHVVAHSAGAVFMAPLVRLLAGGGRRSAKIASCTLWAPACTTALFKSTYQPLIENGRIRAFALYTLSDDAEQDDNCAGIYNKSLLYLVGNGFEEQPRIPPDRWHGTPLLGLAKDVEADEDLLRLLQADDCEWIRAPEPAGRRRPRSTARRHGDFDDDEPTLKSTLARILGTSKASGAEFVFRPSAGRLADKRRKLSEGR